MYGFHNKHAIIQGALTEFIAILFWNLLYKKTIRFDLDLRRFSMTEIAINSMTVSFVSFDEKGHRIRHDC